MINLDKPSYAYLHCRPDGTPFYVGKGALRRAKYLGERNPYHQAIVSKYGKSNILVGKIECSNSHIAYELEKGLIRCIRNMGVKLTNFTDGGEGGKNPCPETRKRLSEAAKRRGVSEACKLARSAAKKGVPLSEEHRDKLRKIATGKVFTEEHRKNISISAKNRGMPRRVIEAARMANMGKRRNLEGGK